MYGTNLRRVAHSGRRSCRSSSGMTPRIASCLLLPSSSTRSPQALYFVVAQDLHDQSRGYATTTTPKKKKKRYPPPAPKSIAIVGGGLTGLTTAYFITKYLPSAKITIYEASGRLGGWVDTEQVIVKTPDGSEGQVHFERGARMIKAPKRRALKDLDGFLFCELVHELGLQSQLRTASRDTYVGRYVYYPDHFVELGVWPISHILKRPLAFLSHIARFIRGLKDEPVFKDLFSSAYNWWKTRGFRLNNTRESQRDYHDKENGTGGEDMSVGYYLSTRFGNRSLVDNLMSAMMHGIYGGDVWKLSVHSSPLRWAVEKGEWPDFENHIDVADKSDEQWRLYPSSDTELLRVMSEDRMTSLLLWERGWAPDKSGDPEWMWFKNGFSTLTSALGYKLITNPNVTVKYQSVDSLCYDATDTIALTTKQDRKTVHYNKVISTVFAGNLSRMVKPGLVPTLGASKAVTIQLVNIWYPTPGLNHSVRGFGYLLPQTTPLEQNPEGALGVLFDSDRDAAWNFDNPPPGSPRTNYTSDTVPGTKFTVMLGGHLWDELPKELWPSNQEAIEMAKSVLARHLGISKEESDRAVGSTKLCRQCIPQHFVGHRKRMKKLEGELQKVFRGRLAVVGGSYQLPGVLPSIRAAWNLSRQVAGEYDARFHARQDERELRQAPGPTGLRAASKPMPISVYTDKHEEKLVAQVRRLLYGKEK